MTVRERVRHEMAMRHLAVADRRQLTPNMVRITLAGPELDGFASPGPSDHVKVFFPDPATGTVTAPELSADGLRRPTDGLIVSRDYTPCAFRPGTDGTPSELDIDFVVHGSPEAPEPGIAPASAFAQNATIGDPLVVAGPRASWLAPTGISQAVLIADETGLPAFCRWLDMLGADVEITALLEVEDERSEAYLTDAERRRASIEWCYRIDGPGQLDEAVRSIGQIDPYTYVWAAGESTALAPVRRYLRRALGIAPDQLSVEGYWRRGVTNFDHHAPIDPSDPD